MRNVLKGRRHGESERGGALLELAIAVPIFVLLIAVIFDAGLGFSAARSSSSAARSAARVAALAGEERLADFRALDAVRAEFANSNDTVVQVTVYRSAPATSGTVPSGCGLGGGSVAGLCNVYLGSALDSLTKTQFDDPNCFGDVDQQWCPTDRRGNDGDYLGVAVWTIHDATIGLFENSVPSDGDFDYDIEDRAVFALYFPPLPAAP